VSVDAQLLLDDITEPDAVAAEVEQHYSLDADLKSHHALGWEEAVRFVEGDHAIRRVNSVNQMQGIPQASQRSGALPYPKTNYIFRGARLLMSNLVSHLPQGVVRPKTNQPKDKNAARVGTAAREVLWEETNENRKYRELAAWVVSTGAGIKKDYLDYTVSGRRSLYSPQAENLETEEGVELRDLQGELLEEEGNEELPEAVISSAILSPFQFGFDPFATNLDNAEWVLEANVRTIPWIQEMYAAEDSRGEKREGYTGAAADVQPERELSATMLSWYRLKTAQKGIHRGADSNFRNSAIVKEYYREPCDQYPKGRMVVVANHRTLYDSQSPYMPYFWHPYTLFSWFNFPGRVWPLSAVEQAVPIQRRINSIDFFWQLYRRTCLGPKLLLPKGSGIPRNHLIGVPGQVLDYNAAAGQPVQVQMPLIGSEIVQERDRAIQDLENIMGTNDPISGERAKGTPSYAAQAFLEETAQRAHGITHADWEEGLARSETKRLQLVAMAYTDDRPAFTDAIRQKLESSVGEAELSAFVGTDLEDNVRVRIEPGSSQPKSKVLEQEKVKELLQLGLLNHVMEDPQMRHQLFELLEIEQFASMESDDVVKAEAENALVQAGIYDLSQMILKDEMHEVHLMIHQKRLKRILRDGTPEQGTKLFREFVALLKHIAAHNVEMQQMAMGPQGMPAGPPGQQPPGPPGQPPAGPPGAAPAGPPGGNPGMMGSPPMEGGATLMM
jgi:hypothetical protein